MKTLEEKSKIQLWKSVISSLVGVLGSSIYSFGLSLMLLEKIGSSMSFAISLIVWPIMSMLLMPIVGPVVDRYSRKKVIIISQLFTIFSMVLFTIYWLNGPKHILAVVVVLKIAIQASDQFTSSAQQAAKVHLVLEDDLGKLAGYTSSASSLSGIISSVAGAALYAFLPFWLFIALEILTECITLLITLTLDFSLVEKKEEKLDNDKGTFREGINYVRKQKFLFAFILMCTGLNFFSGVFQVGLPMLLIRDLGISNFQYGITESAFSIGMLISGFIIARMQQPHHPFLFSWRLSFLMSLMVGILGTVIFLPRIPWLVTIVISLMLVVYGFAQTLFNIPISVWLQKEIPSKIQGRFWDDRYCRYAGWWSFVWLSV